MIKKNNQSFIFNLFKSVKDFDYYNEVNTEKISKSIKYFIILICIYALVSTIGICYNIQKNLTEVKNFINTEINTLSYTNGNLTINNDEYKSFFNNYIIIDTSKEINDENEQNANIVIGKKYCSIKLENNVFKFKYNDYIYEDINKDDIMQFFNNSTKYYVILFILTFLIVTIVLGISTITDVLVIALIGIIISKIIGNDELKFSNLFKMAIHAITLPVILGMIYYTINVFTGFYIKYFSIMYTSIATIYMVTAILLITTDKYKDTKKDI